MSPAVPPAPRIVVTRALPPVVLEPLHAAGQAWVSPHDRPLSVEEQIVVAALAGKGVPTPVPLPSG